MRMVSSLLTDLQSEQGIGCGRRCSQQPVLARPQRDSNKSQLSRLPLKALTRTVLSHCSLYSTTLAHSKPLLCPAGTKLADDFTGRVVEVVSGDCLVVKDSASSVERRVNLSSLRAPRMGRKGERPDTYATEAKEFLRQRLIGELIGAWGGMGSYGQYMTLL